MSLSWVSIESLWENSWVLSSSDSLALLGFLKLFSVCWPTEHSFGHHSLTASAFGLVCFCSSSPTCPWLCVLGLHRHIGLCPCSHSCFRKASKSLLLALFNTHTHTHTMHKNRYTHTLTQMYTHSHTHTHAHTQTHTETHSCPPTHGHTDVNPHN